MAASAHWCQVYTNGTPAPKGMWVLQAAPSTSDLILLPWILWWHTTLALWRTHQPTQSQKSIHLLFRTLSTWINLHWLIKRLLKISHALTRMETNNAKQVSKCSITMRSQVLSECTGGRQDEVRMVAKNPLFELLLALLLMCHITSKAALRCGKWMAVNKRVKICTVVQPESCPHRACVSAQSAV